MLPKLTDFLSRNGFGHGTQIQQGDLEARLRFIEYFNRALLGKYTAIEINYGRNPCRIVLLRNSQLQTNEELKRRYLAGEIRPARVLPDNAILNNMLERSYDPVFIIPKIDHGKYTHLYCGHSFDTMQKAESHIAQGGCRPSNETKWCRIRKRWILRNRRPIPPMGGKNETKKSIERVR